jgi:Tol biopolymer transport system component
MRKLLHHLVAFVVFVSPALLFAEARVISRIAPASEPNGLSWHPAVSPNGAFVTFSTQATNFIPSDTNGTVLDLLLFNRSDRSLELISVNTSGGVANGSSFQSALSFDGQFVAFDSTASDIVLGDSNGAADIFVRGRALGTTSRVSLAFGGGEANGASTSPALSSDGHYVVFQSDASNLVDSDNNSASDIFLRDLTTNLTELISTGATGQGNGPSFVPAVSADGRFVTFYSLASNFVAGDTPGTADVFLRDRLLGTTQLISASAASVRGNNFSWNPSLSADGHYVAFESAASNLVAGDTNSSNDIFLFDRLTGGLTLISHALGGGPADGGSTAPKISADGTAVVFYSAASNLTAGGNTDNDLFLYLVATGAVSQVNLTPAGTDPDFPIFAATAPTLSADGATIAFSSQASDLVSADSNNVVDIFVSALPGAGPPPPPSTCDDRGAATLPFAPRISRQRSVINVFPAPDSCAIAYYVTLRGKKRSYRKLSFTPKVSFRTVKRGTYQASFRVYFSNGALSQKSLERRLVVR